MMAMSQRPSYYDTDEWVEYDESIRAAAERHGVEIISEEHAAGIWQDQTEPAGAYEVHADSMDEVRAWAEEVAGRYGQDSVMVGEYNTAADGRVYSYDVDGKDTREVLEALRAAGIPGARAYDGKLEIASTEGDLADDQLRALRHLFGEGQVAHATIEFIEMKGSRSPGADQDEHLKRTPIKAIQMLRQNYNDQHGIPPRKPIPHLTSADDIAAADAYQAGPHQPNHPKVQRSYRSFRQHIGQQWDMLTEAGYNFEPWSGINQRGEEQEQPYNNSAEMLADLRNNKHLYYFRTEVSQSTEGALPPGHPMAKQITVTTTDGRRQQMVANDVFRAVHDTIAHSEGHQFGPYGEKRAWWTHRSSLPSQARLALWNETRAQNAWTNAGPHMRITDDTGHPRIIRKGEPGWIPQTHRPYAEQKCVLPDDPETLV